MRVEAFHIAVALKGMERHAAKLHHAAARAVTKGEHLAADALAAEANGVDWAMRRLRLAMSKRAPAQGVPNAVKR